MECVWNKKFTRQSARALAVYTVVVFLMFNVLFGGDL